MLTCCRSLTGAWIETTFLSVASRTPAVAPLRGRGLKLVPMRLLWDKWEVAPLRGRGLKQLTGTVAMEGVCRSLTGAWIETRLIVRLIRRLTSLPYGGVD